MKNIRKATLKDLARIAEIEIFNYRPNFYPIFLSDWYYFNMLNVPARMDEYKDSLDSLWVYDDGVVKGFVMAEKREIKKLFVEPVLQSKGIGRRLLEFAKADLGGKYLWALEKNTRAISFYTRNGFMLNGDKKFEDDTTEYLVKLTLENDYD